MTQGVRYSAEVRAAVLAAILAGASVSETARRFHVDKATVSRWAATDATVLAIREREQQQYRVDAISQALLELIHAHVAALRAQLAVLAERDYLANQPIDGVAEMFDSEGNLLLRLLAGMRPKESAEEVAE